MTSPQGESFEVEQEEIFAGLTHSGWRVAARVIGYYAEDGRGRIKLLVLRHDNPEGLGPVEAIDAGWPVTFHPDAVSAWEAGPLRYRDPHDRRSLLPYR